MTETSLYDAQPIVSGFAPDRHLCAVFPPALDLAGSFVFALSGALAAVRARLDVLDADRAPARPRLTV